MNLCNVIYEMHKGLINVHTIPFTPITSLRTCSAGWVVAMVYHKTAHDVRTGSTPDKVQCSVPCFILLADSIADVKLSLVLYPTEVNSASHERPQPTQPCSTTALLFHPFLTRQQRVNLTGRFPASCQTYKTTYPTTKPTKPAPCTLTFRTWEQG